MENFVHIHSHTEYSLLDGFNRIDNLINKTKELDMKAIAITDHGTLAGTYEFHKKCKTAGIKPILGCEMYYTHDMKLLTLPIEDRKDKALLDALNNGAEIPPKAKKKDIDKLIEPYLYDTRGYHLILLAKNQTGWNNLVKLTSEANEYGLFNGNPHTDMELLKKYSEGLICSTACIGSVICSNLRKGKFNEAEGELLKLKKIFGDDLYIEIQPLNWNVQLTVNMQLIDLAKKHEIKIIATNDNHYTNKEDHYHHDILLCIGTKKKLSDTNRMKYSNEFWVRSYEEMIEAFKLQFDDEEYLTIVKEALANTMEIESKIEDNIQLGSDYELLPKVEVPNGFTPERWITRQCWLNLYKFLKKENKTDKRRIYEKRLKEELEVIVKKGFSSYILIVQDAINWGDKNGAPFGPGRGSGAGSLVLFLLGITKGTDPVEYGLLFSRFLTMNRTAMPDIDSDVSRLDRQKLIHYLDNRYGHDNTCQVGTITFLGVKNGIKDIARVLDMPFAEVNAVTKAIDEILPEPSISFKKLDKLEVDNPTAYSKFKALETKYKDLFDIARAFEGLPRNYGVHAGGVLITPSPVNDYFPTRTVDGKRVTVWDKNIVEEAGGVKYDFLGLNTVSIINLTLKFIEENHGIKITMDELYNLKDIRNDENVFDMIKKQQSEAVFQMESNLFKNIIKDVQPDNINDLIAITSVARPGPLAAHMDQKYWKRKHGVEDITYPVHDIEHILGDTFGTIIYQEQIMQIAQHIAGFDDNQADSYLRKALAKKDKAKMELCKEWLIYGKPEQDKHGAPIKGAINNGYDKNELLAFWSDLEGYASYLFNKSHATSYSLISNITAYLKCYYPAEFFAAVLSLDEACDKDVYFDVLKNEFGITVDIPDINLSDINFKAIDKKILYGLSSIKGVGPKVYDPIMDGRPYKDLEDFVTRLPKKVINKTVGTSLIKAGAFSSVHKNRNKLLNQFYDIRKDKDERLDEEAYNKYVCMAYEKDRLESYITYKPWFDKYNIDDKVSFSCKVLSKTEKIDKNGRLMAFVKVQADECLLEVVVFASKYGNNQILFDIGTEIDVKGKKSDTNKVTFTSGKLVW